HLVLGLLAVVADEVGHIVALGAILEAQVAILEDLAQARGPLRLAGEVVHEIPFLFRHGVLLWGRPRIGRARPPEVLVHGRPAVEGRLQALPAGATTSAVCSPSAGARGPAWVREADMRNGGLSALNAPPASSTRAKADRCSSWGSA